MRAVVVDAAGGPEVLRLHEDWPEPTPKEGEVLIEVRAFGLNRSELFTRQGHSPAVLFPRVLGVECVGEVIAAPGADLSPGDRVAAIMGGMGRDFDGGYAERCCVPRACVTRVETDLPWALFGAIPEMLQTAAGSLRVLGVSAGDTLLIRGASSSVGMTATALARQLGVTVLATTRSSEKAQVLQEQGADYVFVGTEPLSGLVHQVVPDGVHAVLDLVGTTTLADSLTCARPMGVVCMTGILGGRWVWPEFEPMADIPTGVRLTAYSGGAADQVPGALQAFCDAVAAGDAQVPLADVFALTELVQAHRAMEANRFTGKCVGVVRAEDLRPR